MKVLLMFIPIIVASSGWSSLIYPFDGYIETVKAHHPSSQVIGLIRSCGLSIQIEKSAYALERQTWVISTNLPKDVFNAESDFLTTAEVWKQSKVGYVVNLWTTDAESEQNTIYCFSSNGAIRFIQSTHWSIPYEGDGKWSYAWIYVQYLTFDTSGQLIHKTGHFVNQMDEPIATPQLDASELEDFDFVLIYKRIGDFKFPAQMFR